MNNPVVWFEIPARDLDRAETFYSRTFGFDMRRNQMGDTQMAWFPMQDGAYGSTGTLVLGEHYAPSMEGTTVCFSVDDIEATLARAEENGGRALTPKVSIGEHGFFANLADSEGNKIAVHSMT
jgi:hypothetical protein